MKNGNNIKEQLLKQMDTNPEADKKSIQDIFAKEQKQVKRAKVIAIISWLLVVVLTLGVEFTARIASNQKMMLRDVIIWIHSAVGFIVYITAIVSTISYFLRSRRLNQRKIEARLSSIEKLLKEMPKPQ